MRVGEVDGELVVNPGKKQLEKSRLNIVVSVASNRNVGKDIIKALFEIGME